MTYFEIRRIFKNILFCTNKLNINGTVMYIDIYVSDFGAIFRGSRAKTTCCTVTEGFRILCSYRDKSVKIVIV